MAATPAMFSVVGLTSLGDQRVPSGEVRLSLDLRIPIDPGHGPDPGSADTRGMSASRDVGWQVPGLLDGRSGSGTA